MKESTRVLIAIAAAVAGGTLIAASGSASLLAAADVVAPVGTLWVNAIRMTVIPLVFSLIITGVASATSTTGIGRIGGRTLVVFFLLMVETTLIIVPLTSVVFSLLPANVGARPPLPAGAAEAVGQLTGAQAQTFGTWLTSLIPSNPVAAAASGAMLPLIIFTLLLALAISRSPAGPRAVLVGFFDAFGEAMFVLVRWIIMLAPIGVFGLVLPLAARAGGALAGAIGFYVVAYSALSLFATALFYPVVAMFARIPMRQFARAVLPAQLIAFSSSSSMASLPAQVDSAERGLGWPSRITGFVLPLAVSLFKPAAPVSWTAGACFIAWFYGVPLHAKELATIGFAAVFLASAAPGIPRGAFIMLAPLFIAVGLPVEGIGILLAVDAFPDTFSTIVNVTGNLAASALVARAEGVSVVTPPETDGPEAAAS